MILWFFVLSSLYNFSQKYSLWQCPRRALIKNKKSGNKMKLPAGNPSIFLQILVIIIGSCLLLSCSPAGPENAVESPNGAISVEFSLTEDGEPEYSITYNGTPVLLRSRLGIVMEDEDFSGGLELQQVSRRRTVTDTYEMINSKRSSISYRAKERTFTLKNGNGRRMDVIFRVSDDGVAFRYFFPGQSDDIKQIVDEVTTFVFPEDARAWIQPMAPARTGWNRTNPSYEEFYEKDVPVGTAVSMGAGWVYPALFRSNDVWMLVSETGIDRNYCGTRLRTIPGTSAYKVGFPQEEEVFPGGVLNPHSTLPWATPWRIIAMGSLADIVENTLGTDLAYPEIPMDESFIKPGRSSWSWVLLKEEYTIYEVQKEFIDYAAEMGWEYTLVDAHWDEQIGYDRIRELAEYAATKGVELHLWYNSAGDWNDTPLTPKDRMLTREDRHEEFAILQDMGIRGIKVDFFPGDAQSAMEYYQDIFEDAAEYGLLINCHGSTIPRGWHRTYPNLMTMESVRGYEFITFDQDNADRAANHATMQPFTRNVFDPMDYTPVAFSEIPDIERRTTNGFEIATAVLFWSGIQHYAEIPEGMAAQPDFVRAFMSAVPAVWDDIRFIDGYPGEYVIVARRSGGDWFISGINGEDTERTVSVDLSFAGNFNSGVLITDGADDRTLIKTDLDGGQTTLDLTLRRNGGFAVRVGGD
jgi:hypothetical protein